MKNLNELGKFALIIGFCLALTIAVSFLNGDKTNYKLNLLKSGKIEVTTGTKVDTIELDSLIIYIENNEI